MARSSAKSRSSKCDSKSHCIPLDLSDVDFFITQSIVIRKSIGEMTHHFLTPDSIWNQSDVLLLRIMLHSNFSQNILMVVTSFDGIPQFLSIFYRVILLTLSKAFLKSIKVIRRGLFHSIHCSMIFLRVKIWSMQTLSFLNPACSSLNFLSISPSIRERITLKKTLLGVDSKFIPRRLSHTCRSPFLGNLTFKPFAQASGMDSLFQLL